MSCKYKVLVGIWNLLFYFNYRDCKRCGRVFYQQHWKEYEIDISRNSYVGVPMLLTISLGGMICLWNFAYQLSNLTYPVANKNIFAEVCLLFMGS